MKEIFVGLHKDGHKSVTYKQETMDSDETVLYYSVKQVSDEVFAILTDLDRYKEAKEIIESLI